MSIRAYANYRDSEVEWLGAVPGHWETVRVRRLFEIKKRISGEEGYDVLSITQKGIKVRDTESNDGQLAMDYSKYQFVYPGDFAMNHMDLLTGYIDISRVFGVTSPDYRVFSTKLDQPVCPEFFLYLFQLCYQRKIFYAFGQGASQLGRWRLPTDQFNEFGVPLPPLPEQSAIAHFLDRETSKIDALVEAQRRLIELLKEKRQAVISHAVTKGLNPSEPMKDSGVEWLGEVPAHWDAVKLCRLTRQIVDGAHFTPTYVDEGVPFLRVTDITRRSIDLDEVRRIPLAEHIELTKRCRPQKGDLLLSKNGTIGIPEIVTWDWDFSIFVSLCLIKVTNRLDARFAKYVFLSKAIELQINDGMKQSTVSNLHLEKISGFRFPVPPLVEQVAISAELDRRTLRLNELISEAYRGISLLQERRGALISAAVTGKIDVRGILPAEAVAA